jgi:hypothetical protein
MNNKLDLDKQLNIMTNQLLNGHEIEYSESIQHWYRKHYHCQKVPKPTDSDIMRLAVKASIIERLVEVLNSPPRNEHQAIPKWCREIKGLKKSLKLQSARLLEDEMLCEAFEKINLQVVKNFMYFI